MGYPVGKGTKLLLSCFVSKFAAKLFSQRVLTSQLNDTYYKVSYNMIIYHSFFKFLLVYC